MSSTCWISGYPYRTWLFLPCCMFIVGFVRYPRRMVCNGLVSWICLSLYYILNIYTFIPADVRCMKISMLPAVDVCVSLYMQMQRIFRWRHMSNHSERRFMSLLKSTADDSIQMILAASRNCYCVFQHCAASDLSARVICSWANCAKTRARPRRCS